MGPVPILQAAALAVVLVLALVAPRAAWATYADVTDSYPASQEVTVSGDAIPASKIPNGTYSITGSTSSYMCIISNCTLTVKDGAMSVTFTISKAYTRLYLGTAEEAASKTNADGTDDSAYYKGTPPDGYVSHVYTLPISELNHKITLATYAGGTKTRKWFTRTVVFNSSAQVDEAVRTGKSPSNSKSDDNGNKKNGGSDDPKDNGNNGGGTKKAKGKQGSKSAGSGAKKSAGSGSGSSASSSGSSGAGSASASGSGASAGAAVPSDSGADGSEDDASSAKADSGSASDPDAKASGPKVRVVEITPTTAGVVTGSDVVLSDDDDDDSEDDTAYNVVLGAVLAGLAALVVALVFALRRGARARRRL